jgi:hypothetical protein
MPQPARHRSDFPSWLTHDNHGVSREKEGLQLPGAAGGNYRRSCSSTYAILSVAMGTRRRIHGPYLVVGPSPGADIAAAISRLANPPPASHASTSSTSVGSRQSARPSPRHARHLARESSVGSSHRGQPAGTTITVPDPRHVGHGAGIVTISGRDGDKQTSDARDPIRVQRAWRRPRTIPAWLAAHAADLCSRCEACCARTENHASPTVAASCARGCAGT